MNSTRNFNSSTVWAALVLGVVLAGGAMGQERPALAVRSVDGRIEVGTDTSAPYYLQWCAPMGEWANWTENALIEPTLKSVWFRARFEDVEGDPMAWDPPADVPFYAAETIGEGEGEDDIRWVSVGAVDEGGAIRVVAARDWMLENVPAAPVASTNPLETVAVPDAGTVRLFWRNRASNRSYIWHLSDDGTLKAGKAVYEQNLATAWIIAATGDFNRDGVTDILWHNQSTGRVYAWFLEPDGLFASGTAVLDANLDTSWEIVDAKDMNGDGHVDIVFHHQAYGRVAVWYLEDGVYQSDEAVTEVNAAPPWKIVGVEDMNGDGHMDLVLHNQSSGRSVVWFLENGVYQNYAAVHDINLATSWKIVGVADMDGDGHADLVYHNSSTGRAVVWFLENGVYKNYAAVHDVNLPTSWKIVGVKDVDNNGSPDLIFHNSSSGRAVVWFLEDGAYQNYEAIYGVNLATSWGVDSVDR
jgi:elongation factor P hydroxylase